MPKATQKRASTRARAGAKPAKPAKPATTKSSAGTAAGSAARRFVDDLLIRGEADKLDKNGKLPQHATHEIKKQNPDGSVEVARVRFKAF